MKPVADHMSLSVFLSYRVDKKGSAYNLSLQTARSFLVVVQGPLEWNTLLKVLILLESDLRVYAGIKYQPSPIMVQPQTLMYRGFLSVTVLLTARLRGPVHAVQSTGKLGLNSKPRADLAPAVAK